MTSQHILIQNSSNTNESSQENEPEDKNSATDKLDKKRAKQVSLKQTFSALKHRNYRLWFFGQLISLLGMWMQSTAVGYLVFELTHSSAYLGYVGFAAGIPAWFLTLYGGVVADRISRRRLLIFTQIAMMLLAFVLAFLTGKGLVRTWHVLSIAVGFGIANAFDAPARQAFVLEMVNREDLTNAIALNSMMFNSATTLGPALGGLLYGLFGPASCFLVNALSYLAVIGALALMRLPTTSREKQRKSATSELKEGILFVIKHPIIRLLIVGIGATSLFGFGVVTLMPAWAVKILKGNATTNGLLLSARGLGSLIGALTVASLAQFNFRGRLLTIGSLALPVFLIIFSIIRWLPFSLAALVGIGWAFMLLFNVANALIQIQIPEALRGRVMSIYTLTFFGLMPIGSLLTGLCAAKLTEPSTVIICAIIMFAFAVLAWVRFPQLRKME